MPVKIDKISSQQFNVFEVSQLTPDTFLSQQAGVDYVEIPPNSISEVHRHNESDALIFTISGKAKIELDGNLYDLEPSMRIFIPRGMTHGFQTNENKLQFISVQVPPIKDDANGKFDLEVIR